MLTDLTRSLRPALVFALLIAVLTGILYPLAITGVAQLVFPPQANGSLVSDASGGVRGSDLIGQAFAAPRYFHGRPSAAGKGYDALASSGSNLGPASQALAHRVRTDVAALRTSPGDVVPADLVTTSASGLDPHISPEAALSQVSRVAAARDASVATIRALVGAQTERPLLGILGEPRVNVLRLNRALDAGATRL